MIKEGTEFLDQLKDSVHDLYDENKGLKQEIKRLKEEYVMLQNASDKVEEEKDKEIERLKKRERKWQKWATEKSILSTKMCEYLCKYQNLKREYSRLVDINTNRKKEIERLNNIIDKAIEYIEENKGTYESNEYCFDNMLEDVIPLLNILKGSDKE